MGSQIEAVVYTGSTRPAALPPDAHTVRLGAGLSMVPVTDEVADRLDEAAIGDERIPAGWMLLQPVAALAKQVSAGRCALYVCGETFGGTGTQEAIGWQDGQLLFGPLGTSDLEADLEPGYCLAPSRDSAINAGLRALGVQAAPGLDEYATVGLTKHRMTEDWLDQPAEERGAVDKH